MMVYGCLWFRLTFFGETQFLFCSPDYDSSKSRRNPWFLGTNTSFRCSPPHPDPRRIWEGGSCTMEAVWIYGESRHRKKVLEIEECGKPVNPTIIIMILVDLQFGGSIPTISGEIWSFWMSIVYYWLYHALPHYMFSASFEELSSCHDSPVSWHHHIRRHLTSLDVKLWIS